MVSTPSISLIICTHNRADKLNHSLAYYADISAPTAYEILIVANACTDHTLQVVEKHMESNPRIRSIVEPKIGHSNARNAGWQNANAPFVFYIDDDAYPASNIIAELKNLVEHNAIKCIGGRTKYWDYDSPKWITADLVEPPVFLEKFGLMPARGYINGCACGFEKQVLQNAGGFNPEVGMRGNKMGYYDEVYMQERLQALGYPIHYSPELIVYHQSHQKTLSAFLRAYYIQGKSKKRYAEKEKTAFWGSTMRAMVSGTISVLANCQKHGIKTGIIKSYSSFFYYFGQLIA